MKRAGEAGFALLALALVCLVAGPALAAGGGGTAYRELLDLDSRTVVWVVAQLHLLFGAFVLGVPIFAVIVELVGVIGGEERYDRLAREFTKLLSAAFSTTAALGGTLAFLLIGLYPRFMSVLGDALHGSFYVYAGLFFAEAFTLYLYYYGWDRLKGRTPNLPRAMRPAWMTTGALGAAIIGLLLFHGQDTHPLRTQGEEAAGQIAAVGDALGQAVESALEWGEVGALTDEGAWPQHIDDAVAAAGGTEATRRAGAVLLPVVVDTLKNTRAEAIASRLARNVRAAADQARLDAFNRSSVASASHWATVGIVALGLLVCFGFASYATSSKGFHLYLGLVLNVAGIAVMMIANSWVTYMMSPVGVNASTLEFGGTTWGAVTNPLWHPLNLHRLLANIVFGGFVAGSYAAIRFLGSSTPEERAHYDWMGYVGNFVGILAMIPLPFAGYYLGREVYSYSPIMGNNMMGGAFSWAFIFQAILIGVLFIGANYYLWIGMGRIPGSERYRKYIPWYSLVLMLCFAIWVTPHNLPLTGEERALMGGVQYHPLLKYLGLMPAKNAVVNLIILTTFFCFLMYRRANKGETQPFSSHGVVGKLMLSGALAAVLGILGWYTSVVLGMDLSEISVPEEKRWVTTATAGALIAEMAVAVLAAFLAMRDRGKLAQALYFAVTALIVTGFLGVWGFVTMVHANPFLRNIAVCQVLMVLSAMILNGTIDVFLFRGAREVGGIRWGEMPARSQYTLVVVTVAVVQLMCLMGFIRSGLREDWHIYGVMRDTSAGAGTPTLSEMGWTAGWITLGFFALLAFVFWLGSLGEKADLDVDGAEKVDFAGAASRGGLVP